jgi:GNAT superfamily N-acetyltransferase
VNSAVSDVPLVTARPAAEADAEFLLALFAEARPELDLVPAPMREQLLRMQFEAQLRSYRSTAPDAVDLVLEVENGAKTASVGRCYLAQTSVEHRLLDLAVAPRWRGRGIGTAVLEQLRSAAARAGVPLRLTVWHQNVDAQRLYERLGFVTDESEGASGPAGYLALRWPAGDAP